MDKQEMQAQNGKEKEVGVEEKELSLSKMTWRERWKFLTNNITVEPMVACYIMPCVFASLATQNLAIEKACRVNLAYSNEVCDALSNRQTENYTKEESEVQQMVAAMGVWKTILQSALPALLIMFVGSWSDRWGLRKPCMLFPIVGEFFTVIGLMVARYFFYETPMEIVGVIEGFFPAITGGWFTMFMGVFSYVGDVTTIEERTLRIGIVNVFCSLGIPVGLALSGIAYKVVGFYGVFSISAVMYVIAFCYCYFCVEEPKIVRAEMENKGVGAFTKDFFNIKHVCETFKVAFKEGENNRKMKVLLLMLVVMVVIGPMHGEMVVMYLFTRFRFNWDELDFSIYSTYNMVTSLIGTSISVYVFSQKLKIDDAIVGVISSLSKVFSSFVYAFAQTTLVFYLGSLVEIFNGTSFIAMRSIASKLVPPEELGKVMSLFGVCEALMPLVYGPMYSSTYRASMNTMPGAFLLLGGGLTIPAVIIFFWMYLQHKKERQQAEHTNIYKGKTLVLEKTKEATLEPAIIVNGTMGIENSAYEEEKERL